nr:hypothetical protein Iba_chr06dCG8390 [Ipomoea batatas]
MQHGVIQEEGVVVPIVIMTNIFFGGVAMEAKRVSGSGALGAAEKYVRYEAIAAAAEWPSTHKNYAVIIGEGVVLVLEFPFVKTVDAKTEASLVPLTIHTTEIVTREKRLTSIALADASFSLPAAADDEGEARHCGVKRRRRHDLKERRVLQFFAGLVRDAVEAGGRRPVLVLRGGQTAMAKLACPGDDATALSSFRRRRGLLLPFAAASLNVVDLQGVHGC